MKTLAYYNGSVGEIDDVCVPFNERSHWFGDGVYDAASANNHVIFALEEHVERFFESARIVGIELGVGREWLAGLLRELSGMVESPSQFVYWQATRSGDGLRRHAFPKPLRRESRAVDARGIAAGPALTAREADSCAVPKALSQATNAGFGLPGASASLWAMITPAEPIDTAKTLKLITVEDKRFLYCHAKTLNLLPNALASQAAEEAGCDEAVLHRDGRVTECAHSNIGILKDGVFRTAPLDCHVLPGVSRARMLRYCDELGIPSACEPFTLDELRAADEVVVMSSSRYCNRACEIDSKPVGGRAIELFSRLQGAAVARYELETAPVAGMGRSPAGADACQ